MIELERLLREAREKDVSDVHLKVGREPIFRVHGSLYPQSEYGVISKDDMEFIIESMITPEQEERLKHDLSIDVAFVIEGVGRHRVNIYRQKGEWAIAIRLIPAFIKSITELNLPRVLEKLALSRRGLILVTGVAGSGKSTTLAAMLSHINKNRTCTIITIEDPIEYELEDEKAYIVQREVGLDTQSFAHGLKEALRQDPNVIMVGEIRDLETAQTALLAAETGHLVFSTLHTLDARETINRFIAIFPSHQQDQIRLQLAAVLRATIAQRLVPRSDMPGLVPAAEIMVNTARISEMIKDPSRTHEIQDAIADGFVPYGMQTVDQSLFYLWKKEVISKETALEFATQRETLELRMRGISSGEEGRNWELFERRALRELREKKKQEGSNG